MMCLVLPSAPDLESVAGVLARLDDDEALSLEADLEGLAAAAADEGARLDGAAGLHLQAGGPGDEGVRVDVGLAFGAVQGHRDAPADQGDPAGALDHEVGQGGGGQPGERVDRL